LHGHAAGWTQLPIFAVGRQHDDDDDRQEERKIGDGEHGEEELGDGGSERSVASECHDGQVVAGDAERARQSEQRERHDERKQLQRDKSTTTTSSSNSLISAEQLCTARLRYAKFVRLSVCLSARQTLVLSHN